MGKFLKRKDFQCDELCIGGRRSGRDRDNLARTPRRELREPRIFFEMLEGTPEDRMRTPGPGCDVVK